MTDFAPLLVADRGQMARPIHLVDQGSFEGWLKKRPAEDRALLEAMRLLSDESTYMISDPPQGEAWPPRVGAKLTSTSPPASGMVTCRVS